MNKVVMKNIGTNTPNHLYGSALYCIDCNSIDIDQSEFSNMISYKGGAFYIEEL